jgi:predicted nucleic acid-binding protein
MLVVDASAVDELLRSTLMRLTRSTSRWPSALHRLIADLLDFPDRASSPRCARHACAGVRENFTAYDAVYVALAEAITDRDAPLLTADGRLVRTAAAHTNLHVILAKQSG